MPTPSADISPNNNTYEGHSLYNCNLCALDGNRALDVDSTSYVTHTSPTNYHWINMYRHIFKRLIDIVAAAFILCLTSPILLLAVLALLISNHSRDVFFYQSRPGLHGKIFRIIKLKTMNDAKDDNGNLLPDAERLTKVGRTIRSMSLDELPQLLNVLRGEMSLIGPRPLLPKYIPLYNRDQARRHDVRPGITGWAQCNGRNAISWKQKLTYDTWYVDHLSLSTDLKIVWLTLKVVITRTGISQEGCATAEEFNGHN